jgi:positive regulator of sigma E activity
MGHQWIECTLTSNRSCANAEMNKLSPHRGSDIERAHPDQELELLQDLQILITEKSNCAAIYPFVSCC